MKKEYTNQIFNGNCVEIMGNFPDDFVDLVVTSPPYDNLRTYKGYVFPFNDIVLQLYRILKNGGIVVWVVSDATINGSETGTSFKQALKFMEAGFNLHDTMIFKKTNPVPQIYRKRYTNVFEYMFVFSKGTVSTHNGIKIPCLHAGLELKGTTYKNYSKGDQSRGKLANPVKSEKLKGNIWEYVVGKNAVDQEAKKHPAPFPYQLALDHILSWTNEGEIVLDPMCGSGTTCVAALDARRNYIGIDISKEYCDLAKERVRIHSMQPSLFEYEECLMAREDETPYAAIDSKD
ncbi:MAG: site-specific DNA-methyltransferase [Candidatus Amulumruptor caecigallinarius]|nr:site-specific DNA-methyltransferase [Candidatus Amulumruptor caecigallinarius]MCM1397512.1 site-specific DNA-methyltransferase [Candidatus Amulumruptor caecigallinarius]MCM1454414.1 site-specific DNA-methyltransferase [bacterium]